MVNTTKNNNSPLQDSSLNLKHSGYFRTKKDDVEIYFEVYGEGPSIICNNGVGVSTFFWKYIKEHYGKKNQIILWDYRGHGNSDRNISHKETDLSIERHARDLIELRQHLKENFNIEPTPSLLIGHSMGCQVSLEYWRQDPNLVQGIVLLLGTAGRALETFANTSNSVYVFRGVKRISNKIGGKINRFISPLLTSPIAWPFTQKSALVDPLYTSKKDFAPYLEHLASMDFLVFLEAAWQCQVHDIWDDLPNIKVPVLMIAAENDAFTPISCAKKLTSAIPISEFMVLADGSHAALIEQPDTINFRLDRFIRDHHLLKNNSDR